MSAEAPRRTARTAAIALAATLAIQIYTSFAATATAVLAPELARDFGVESRWIGVFVGIVYVGGMTASLACGGFIERYGSIRVSQACVGLCALGVLAMALAPANAALVLAIAAIVIGLGYGPITPASSQLLQRTAPPSRMALTFSIKQTGVPAGAALSGAILPVVALALDWRVAFALVALFGLAVIGAAQPLRAELDAERRGRGGASFAGVFAPLALLRESRALRDLALVSFAYAAMQVCLTSFLVVHLTEGLHFTLVSAGLALTAATLGGVVGRIAWGYIADRWLAPRNVLALVGVLAGACGLATSIATGTWPMLALVALAALFGSTAIGWNGVQLSEVARHAPPGSAGKVTGATGFVTFAGVVVGPPLFTLLSSATGSYRIGFAAFGAASIVAALALLVRARSRDSGARGQDSRARDKDPGTRDRDSAAGDRASASKDAG
ncbi:MAG TPA: MFS transporter [Casimicrobiaceae bacterium]|nr:MFS transporter [Casimicrobiaceae bacterium]